MNDKWQMTDDKFVRLCRNRLVFEVDSQDLERGASCGPLNSSSVICHLSFVMLLISLCLAGNAFGDGGSVQLHSVSGPFEITLFTEPPLPRAGQIDFSVLIQDAKSGQPVMDATVMLALDAGAGSSKFATGLVSAQLRGQSAGEFSSRATSPFRSIESSALRCTRRNTGSRSLAGASFGSTW